MANFRKPPVVTTNLKNSAELYSNENQYITGKLFVNGGITGSITTDSNLVLTDASAPSSISGATILYAGTASGGGTGVYFVDGSTSDELVSKSKAIVYGLIF